MREFIAVHLLNDFSGSPLVLSNCITSLINSGVKVEIITSNTDGFLSGLSCSYKHLPYKNYKSKYLTLINFIFVQLYIFFLVFKQLIFKSSREKTSVLVNTILPFGAALAAKLCRVEVVYYVHETSIRPRLLKAILKYFLNLTCNKAIYVSNYLKDLEGSGGLNETVIYNSLLAGQSVVRKKNTKKFTVLMLCSLKKYKGIYHFLELAKRCEANENIDFVLALNSSVLDFNSFFEQAASLSNISLLRCPENTGLLYERASLVLNLSKPEEWVETFGMTVIEAYSYSLPVIVPSVGGITEIVKEGVTGFKVSVDDLDSIYQRVIQLSQNKALYLKMSDSAGSLALNFNFEVYSQRILKVLL